MVFWRSTTGCSVSMSAQCKDRNYRVAFEGKLLKVIKFVNCALKLRCSITARRQRHKQIRLYDIHYIIRDKLSSSISRKAETLSSADDCAAFLTYINRHSVMPTREGERAH